MNATEERQQNAAVDRLPTCQMYIVQVRQKNKKRRVQCNQKKKKTRRRKFNWSLQQTMKRMWRMFVFLYIVVHHATNVSHIFIYIYSMAFAALHSNRIYFALLYNPKIGHMHSLKKLYRIFVPMPASNAYNKKRPTTTTYHAIIFSTHIT